MSPAAWPLLRVIKQTVKSQRTSRSWKIHLLWLNGGGLMCVIKLSDSRVKVVSIWSVMKRAAFVYLSSALSGTRLFKRASPSLWGSPDHQCLENRTATARNTGRSVSPPRDSRSCKNSRAQLWGKHTSSSSFRWLNAFSFIHQRHRLYLPTAAADRERAGRARRRRNSRRDSPLKWVLILRRFTDKHQKLKVMLNRWSVLRKFQMSWKFYVHEL